MFINRRFSNMKNKILLIALLISTCQGCFSQTNKSVGKKNEIMSKKDSSVYSHTSNDEVSISDSAWKEMLTPEQYQVARQKGTERPWTSAFENNKEVGTYYCAACGNPLFRSDTKFESGCGWPSFYEPYSKGSIIYAPDNTYGMARTEVMCGRCRSHLGHVFDDGPKPTGLRYCINGVILDFEKAKSVEQDYNSTHKDQQ